MASRLTKSLVWTPATTYNAIVKNCGRHDVEVVEAALLLWIPISPHLASARLKEVTVNLPASLVCDPTLDAEDEDLQLAIDSAPQEVQWSGTQHQLTW